MVSPFFFLKMCTGKEKPLKNGFSFPVHIFRMTCSSGLSNWFFPVLLQKKQNMNEGEKKDDNKGGGKQEGRQRPHHGSKVVKYVKGLDSMLAACYFCQIFLYFWF